MARLLAALVFALACEACPKFTCKSLSIKLDPSICAYFDRSQITWHLNACESEYTCQDLDTSSNSSSYCVWNSAETGLASYPGEKCKYDDDCVLFEKEDLLCTSGYCAGKTLNAFCGSSLECDPGLACFGVSDQQADGDRHSACQPQVKEGGSCNTDFDCVNTCGCDSGVKQCVEYFSIASGDPVGSCSGPQFPWTSHSFLNLLCESGTCASDGAGAVCVDAFTSKSELPVNCTRDSDCVSSQASTHFASSSCSTCGYNLDQSTYCDLFPGDPLFSKLLSVTEDWLSSSSLAKCNTERRFDCMETMWSNYEKWAYYRAATYYYPMVAGAESCVTAVLFPSLYALKVHESAAWCLSAFAFVLVS